MLDLLCYMDRTRWSNQAVRGLLSTISGGGFNAQLEAAAQLSALLEAEESRFRDVVGDPWAAPAAQRGAHSVGKLLACIKVAGQTAPLGTRRGHRWGHDARGHGDTARVITKLDENQY